MLFKDLKEGDAFTLVSIEDVAYSTPGKKPSVDDIYIKKSNGIHSAYSGDICIELGDFTEVNKMETDSQINPEHYKIGGIETWDYLKAKLTPTELAGFAKGNVIKYVSRANHKGKIEDLKKAAWYLNNLIAEIEK